MLGLFLLGNVSAVVLHMRIVESSTVDQVFDNPQQQYTRDLLNAIPGANIKLGG